MPDVRVTVGDDAGFHGVFVSTWQCGGHIQEELFDLPPVLTTNAGGTVQNEQDVNGTTKFHLVCNGNHIARKV